MSAQVHHISSRDNAFLKDLRRLAQQSNSYRKGGQFWVEGDHLCRAALARGVQPVVGVLSESFWKSPQARDGWAVSASKTVVIADALFADISALESPAPMGFVFNLPEVASLLPDVPTVVLDRVQDAGNVGSILRSAAALGFLQVLALHGTAALWSPKVLRAGMGAHWGLHLLEGLLVADLAALRVPLLVTSCHAGVYLHRVMRGEEGALPYPCAWVLGHEGQGVCSALDELAHTRVRIAQPGGEESLNVAAAAAICLHASGVLKA
jgi:RNA methyltransferase, TrmH family